MDNGGTLIVNNSQIFNCDARNDALFNIGT